MSKTHYIRLRTGSWLSRALQTPLTSTLDLERAERSRLTWRLKGNVCYLTPLGILNGLFGVVLIEEDE